MSVDINAIFNMKYLTPIFFLVLLSCQNHSRGVDIKETHIEPQRVIDTSVFQMWNDYIKSNPSFKGQNLPESDFFHNNREDANRLAKLTLLGKKKATSSLFSLYKKYEMDLPKVGTKQIVTDFDGKAKAIIQITIVDTVPFKNVSRVYARLDLGTDEEALIKWRKTHWDFFEKFLGESEEKPNEEMLIVCTSFQKIWPKSEEYN